MNKETIIEHLRKGTGADSLVSLAETTQSVSNFRALFADAVVAAADVAGGSDEEEAIPPLLSDWSFILGLNDAALVPLERYLESVSACPEPVVRALSQKLSDGLRAGCREQHFGRVVRLLLFEIFSGTASAAAEAVARNLMGFCRYCNSEKDADADAIRIAARIGNALAPAKDKLNLSDPLSSFPAWAMTCFVTPNEAGQSTFQDLVSASEGEGAVSPFLAGSRELYSDNALFAALGHFLREQGDRVNSRSFGCLVRFLGVTRNKRAEVLGLLRKHVEDSDGNTETISFLLLLARLCGTRQQYGQWLLGVISDARTPARIVESLTNLIPIDSPEWIAAHIGFLQKTTKAPEGCREYTRCGQMRLEAKEKEADAAATAPQKPQEPRDPETFIDEAFREFFLTKKLPQSFRSAAFFNTSWFNETIVPLLFDRAKGGDAVFADFMACIGKAGIQLKDRKRKQSTNGGSALLTSGASSLQSPELREAFAGLQEACSTGEAGEMLDALRNIDKVLCSPHSEPQPLCPILISEFLRLYVNNTEQIKQSGFQDALAQNYVEACFLKRKETIIEMNAVLLRLFASASTTLDEGCGAIDDNLIQGISVLLSLVVRARGPKEFLNLWQRFQPHNTHNAIMKLRLGVLTIQNLNDSKTAVSLSQDSTPSSDDSLRGRSFMSEVALPPAFFHELYILHQAIFCSAEGVQPGSDAEVMGECTRALRSMYVSQRVVIAMKIQPRKEWLAQELSFSGLLTKGDVALWNERLKMAFTYQCSLMGNQFLKEVFGLAVKAIEENGVCVAPQTASVLAGLGEAAHLHTQEGEQPWVWEVFECERGGRDPCVRCSPALIASFWTACSFLPGSVMFSGISLNMTQQELSAFCDIIEAHSFTSDPTMKIVLRRGLLYLQNSSISLAQRLIRSCKVLKLLASPGTGLVILDK